MTWTPETPLTVGDIRKEMEGLPDDAQAFVDGSPDRPIVGAIQSDQIPHDKMEEWEKGDPLVKGLELWLGGDDEFPAPRCNHPNDERVRRATAKAWSAFLNVLLDATLEDGTSVMQLVLADETLSARFRKVLGPSE